mgnify:CR=1 FL=1
MLAIIALRFHAVGQADKNDSNIRILCCLSRLTQQRGIHFFVIKKVSGREGELRLPLCRLPRGSNAMRMDMGATAALIARLLCKFAKEGDFAPSLSGSTLFSFFSSTIASRASSRAIS